MARGHVIYAIQNTGKVPVSVGTPARHLPLRRELVPRRRSNSLHDKPEDSSKHPAGGEIIREARNGAMAVWQDIMDSTRMPRSPQPMMAWISPDGHHAPASGFRALTPAEHLLRVDPQRLRQARSKRGRWIGGTGRRLTRFLSPTCRAHSGGPSSQSSRPTGWRSSLVIEWFNVGS